MEDNQVLREKWWRSFPCLVFCRQRSCTVFASWSNFHFYLLKMTKLKSSLNSIYLKKKLHFKACQKRILYLYQIVKSIVARLLVKSNPIITYADNILYVMGLCVRLSRKTPLSLITQLGIKEFFDDVWANCQYTWPKHRRKIHSTVSYKVVSSTFYLFYLSH